jgi:hypothetical protein
MTKKFCIAAAVVALLLMLLVVGARPYAVAADQDNIQKNVIDLRTAKFFSRPITELEMIVLNLKAQAKVSASFVGEFSKLHIIKTVGQGPEGDAGFDPTTGRIFLVLSLHVDEMSDPWKETCDSAMGSFYRWFFFPPNDATQNIRLSMMAKYLGEAIRIDKDNAADSIDILLSSIVTRVSFLVVDDNASKPLSWMRTCTKDNLSGQISYTEHRYE